MPSRPTRAPTVAKTKAAPPRPRRTARTARAGRPTSKRVEAMNKAVLAAARYHFLTAGYDETHMDTIASTAQVSKGTLYARYPSKEALRRAVVIEELNRLAVTSTARIKQPQKGLKENLRRHARGIAASLVSPERKALEALIGDAGRAGGDLAPILSATEKRVISEMAQDLLKSSGGVQLRAAAATRLAELLLSALYGWHSFHSLTSEVSAADALKNADRVVDVIFAGRAHW